VKEWLGSQPRLRALDKWLCFEGPVRYRLAVVGAEAPLRLPKPILGAARAALGPMGLLDSPSRYDLELQIRLERGGASLTLRPCFEEDKRFDYRERDVGASINPVIGACLARLVFTGEGAAVRDPTCGSGTLLIERGLMDPAAGLVGVDISPTAVAASRHNATVVGMDDRIKLLKGDAGAARSWKPCDEVVANLPFGVRTRKKDTDLAALYSSVCRHLEANLSREGRAVLYTGAHRTLEQALRGARGLRVRDKFRTRAGGLDVSIFVVQNPGSR
jgi:23S rRNA G2445 N2-methylase RlmL